MNNNILLKITLLAAMVIGLRAEAIAQPVNAKPKEQAALLQRDQDWAKTIATGDLEQIFPFWTDDAVIYPAYRPAVRGKAAIRQFVHANRARASYSLKTEPFEAQVAQARDLGHTLGRYRFESQGADGSLLTRPGIYLAGWRKVPDGGWKCMLEIHSPRYAPGNIGNDLIAPPENQRSTETPSALEPDGGTGSHRAALLQTRRQWSDAIAAGDLERIFSFWTDDAVIYAANRPPVRGKAAIREFVRGNRARPGFSLTSDVFAMEVSRSGDLAYTVGNYEFKWDGPDGTPVQRPGRFVCGWRKNEDGDWRCMLEIHSPLSPLN